MVGIETPHPRGLPPPAESIIGVLMCGLSASFRFAIVTRLVEREALGRTREAPAELIWTPKGSDLSGGGRGERQK
jgi:hypothetical protein